MATEFWSAPDEVISIAREVINKYYTELADVEMALLMRSPTAKSNGCEVWGTASRANAKQRALSGKEIEFVIEFSSDVWESLSITQKRALVDHELYHCVCTVDDDGEVHYGMRGHDIEEFNDIVARHGRWNDSITTFLEQFQLELPHLYVVGE
jgi:predicted metallopeptidase